jgi:hypothetical protein
MTVPAADATIIDAPAIQRFAKAMTDPLTPPIAILEEYRRRGRLPASAEDRPPQAAYRTRNALGQPFGPAGGYPFSWGHILERHVDRFVLWDFGLDRLLRRYHEAGLGLWHLQGVAFDALERRSGRACGDWLWDLSRLGEDPPEPGFGVFPGSAVSAFGVVTHFCREAEARAWVDED